MRRRLLSLSLLTFSACNEGQRPLLAAAEAGAEAAADASEEEPDFADCGEEDTSAVPERLVCTGLYANFSQKRIASRVLEFTPAHPLWSDGAEKRRWIQLPEGKKIDNANPNGWIFPAGTKLWKEFKVGDKRVETRLYWKVSDTFWRNTTYKWNDDETESDSISTAGEDIEVNGETYHLPSDAECNNCHKGQRDRVLGFSAVNLGLPGASGVTLADVWERGMLSEKPPLLELSIGADRTGLDDDGIPLAAKVLGMMHTNCGQTCHNPTPQAYAGLSNQNLRLDSTVLDGRAPDDAFGAIATVVGYRVEGVQWGSRPYRILPGDPSNSLIVQLMSHRDPSGMGKGQMPPFATRKVDHDAVALVERWVRLLAGPSMENDAGEPMDAGTTTDAGEIMDAGTAPMDADTAAEDAGMDSGDQLDAAADAGADADADADAGSDAGEDAGVLDAEADAGADAGVIDAGIDPDASEAGEDAASIVDPDATADG